MLGDPGPQGLVALPGEEMLAGFKAKNHPQQVAKNGADDDTDDRRTPPEIFERLHTEHQFTLDAAASPQNTQLPRFFTREQDGLKQSWEGETVWCNPPYSDLAAWVGKARKECWYGACKKAVLLLPANRCEQSWWQVNIERHRDLHPRSFVRTRFLPGRPRFAWAANRARPVRGDRPPFGLVVVIFERR